MRTVCSTLREVASKQNIPGSCAGSAGILVGETDYTKVTKETFDRISDSSMEKENGNPLQYSCLGNLMDGGAWRAMVAKVRHDLATKQQQKDKNSSPSRSPRTETELGNLPVRLR